MRRRTFNPLFWVLAQAGSRLRPQPHAALDLTAADLPEPLTMRVPTRHGQLRVIIFRPPAHDADDAGLTPPVVMHMHGGGFINRYPEQDRHIARFLAANLHAVIVLPDYGTAPKVRYPVAEEEMFDVARWIQHSGQMHGWAGDHLMLSGVSAGAKLAINVCQQLHLADETRPLAVALTVPVTDMSRTDRTSPSPKPAISPFVQRAVAWSYFPDVERRQEALASPRFDDALADAMPPTLVQTGEFDTLAAEGAQLAATLKNAGIETAHRQYPHADHDFYASQPAENVRNMLTEITTFFFKLNSPRMATDNQVSAPVILDKAAISRVSHAVPMTVARSQAVLHVSGRQLRMNLVSNGALASTRPATKDHSFGSTGHTTTTPASP
jgi:acetyl esterase